MAQEVGLDGPRLLDYLQSDEDVDTIQDLEEQAMRSGLRGVPSIQIGAQTLHGAVDAATLQKALQHAVEEKAAGHGQ